MVLVKVFAKEVAVALAPRKHQNLRRWVLLKHFLQRDMVSITVRIRVRVRTEASVKVRVGSLS